MRALGAQTLSGVTCDACKYCGMGQRGAAIESLRGTDPKSTGELKTSRHEAVRAGHTESEPNRRTMNAEEY